MSGNQKPRSTTNPTETNGEQIEQIARSSSDPAEQHAARFYDSDRALSRIVAEFLHAGFTDGSRAIVVATATQRVEIIRELTDRSFDVDALQRLNHLVLLDASETLS